MVGSMKLLVKLITHQQKCTKVCGN